MNIPLKRVYEKPSKTDGMRILVERLWPRGLSKADAQVDLWAKATAPSTELRMWFDHDPEKWEEFKRRYFAELEAHADVVDDLLQEVRRQRVTFVFASKEEQYNNAVALKEYVATKMSET